MGLQSFLTHAEADPGTQEAIRKLLDGEDAPQRTSPDRMSGVASSSVFAPPIRTADQPLISPPTYNEPLITPPTRIDARQGVSTAGMSPIDAAQARLRVTQEASPQQRISTSDPSFVEAQAPHGISRLKAAGRLFLDQLKHGHGLIGGLFGLGEGLIAPGHAQELKHQQEIAEAQGNLDQVAGNEKTQAQINDIQAQAAERKRQSLLPPKLEPPHEDFRAVTEGEYPNIEAGTQIKRIWNGTKFIDEVDSQGRPTIKAIPPVREAKSPSVQWIENPDGSKTAFVPDPKSPTGWKHAGLPDAAKPPEKLSPESDQWRVTNAAIDENIKAYRQRQAKIDEFLNATPATIQAPYNVTSPAGTTTKYKTVPNPAYESQKKERNDLDNKIAEENGKRKAAPPTRTTSTSQYAGKPWSLGQWRAKNPNATTEQEAAAKLKAANAQMKVVD